MSVARSAIERDGWASWRALVQAVATVTSAAVFGAALVAAAWRTGPDAWILLFAMGIVPLLVLVIVKEPRAAVLTTFVTFSVGFVSIPIGPFDLQAVDGAILLGTLLVVFRRLGLGIVPLRWAPTLWWVVALVVAAVVSFASALDRTEAIKPVGSLVAGLAFAALTYTVCKKPGDIRLLANGLVIVATALVIPSLLQGQRFESYYQGALIEGRLQGLFTEPNELGLFCALAATIALGLLVGSAGKPVARLLYAGMLAVLSGGLLLSLSRGAWLGTLVALVLMLVMLRSARRLLLAIGIPAVMALTIAANVATENPTTRIVAERIEAFVNIDQPYDERPEIYAEAWRQIQDDPLTGQGPGNFAVASERSVGNGATIKASHAHNAYLNIAAELGLPALAFLIALIWSLAMTARRTIGRANSADNKSDAALVAALIAALGANATTGLVNNFFGNAILEPMIWAIVGMLLAAAGMWGVSSHSPRAEKRRLPRTFDDARTSS